MPIDTSGGRTGTGTSLGAAIARAAKPKAGKTVGRSVAKTVRPSSKGRSSGGSSSRSSGGGSSNRSSGGGGGGGGSSRSVPRPRPVSVPSINAYLGTDSAYQNIVRGGKRSLADFLSEMGRRRGESTTQFGQTKASMERDRLQQLDDIRQEFASRGLINSGLFGEEQGKFQQQFTQQMQTMEQQQAALLADLLGQEKNYRRESDLTLEAAKQEALARRAAKYKIGA